MAIRHGRAREEAATLFFGALPATGLCALLLFGAGAGDPGNAGLWLVALGALSGCIGLHLAARRSNLVVGALLAGGLLPAFAFLVTLVEVAVSEDRHFPSLAMPVLWFVVLGWLIAIAGYHLLRIPRRGLAVLSACGAVLAAVAFAGGALLEERADADLLDTFGTGALLTAILLAVCRVRRLRRRREGPAVGTEGEAPAGEPERAVHAARGTPRARRQLLLAAGIVAWVATGPVPIAVDPKWGTLSVWHYYLLLLVDPLAIADWGPVVVLHIACSLVLALLARRAWRWVRKGGAAGLDAAAPRAPEEPRGPPRREGGE